jgi:hypothetical protein
MDRKLMEDWFQIREKTKGSNVEKKKVKVFFFKKKKFIKIRDFIIYLP